MYSFLFDFFAQCHVFEIHSYCSMSQLVVCLCTWTIFHCITVSRLIISPFDGHLGYFQMINKIAVNSDVQILTWTYIFIFLEYMPKSVKARSYDGYMINLWRSYQNLLPSDCTVLYLTLVVCGYYSCYTFSPAFGIAGFFYFIDSIGWVVVTHCIFYLHFPDDKWCWTHPCMYYSFIKHPCEMIVQGFPPTF